jgi:hypothetical protein
VADTATLLGNVLATALVAEAAAALLKVAAHLVDLLNRCLLHLTDVLALAGIAVTALALKIVLAHLFRLVGSLAGSGASAAGLAGLLGGLAVAIGIETGVGGTVGEAAAIAELHIRQKIFSDTGEGFRWDMVSGKIRSDTRGYKRRLSQDTNDGILRRDLPDTLRSP